MHTQVALALSHCIRLLQIHPGPIHPQPILLVLVVWRHLVHFAPDDHLQLHVLARPLLLGASLAGCQRKARKGGGKCWQIARLRPSRGRRFTTGSGRRQPIGVPEKNRERQPRPLSQRPPRRTVEQHLAALPFGSGQALPLLSKDPCGSVWRFSEKQILDALQSASTGCDRSVSRLRVALSSFSWVFSSKQRRPARC
jgi:hypothetical protein